MSTFMRLPFYSYFPIAVMFYYLFVHFKSIEISLKNLLITHIPDFLCLVECCFDKRAYG